MKFSILYHSVFLICATILCGAEAFKEETIEVDLVSSVKLTCPVNIDQHEFPQWYKTDSSGKETEIFFTPDKYDFPDISGLIINNIGENDKGKYYCKIAFTSDIRKIFYITIAEHDGKSYHFF